MKADGTSYEKNVEEGDVSYTGKFHTGLYFPMKIFYNTNVLVYWMNSIVIRVFI